MGRVALALEAAFTVPLRQPQQRISAKLNLMRFEDLWERDLLWNGIAFSDITIPFNANQKINRNTNEMKFLTMHKTSF